ncbi:MAG: ATP-binding protein [Bacteroidia bacterium]
MSSHSSFKLEAQIIEDKIVVLKFSGAMSASDQKSADELILRIFLRYIVNGQPSALYVIADVSALDWVSVSARKTSQLSVSDFFSKGYVRHLLIVSPNYIIRTLFNLLSRFENHIHFSTYKTREEALSYIARLRTESQLSRMPVKRIHTEPGSLREGKVADFQENKESQPGFLRKLLYGRRENHRVTKHTQELQIKYLREELHRLQTNQENKIEQLFRIMSSISWDESFSFDQFDEYFQDDPFSILIDAAEMLQRDIKDMMQESREMHVQLESQIQQRTREIARKEANLSALVENTPDLILSANQEGIVLIANSSLQSVSKKIIGMAIQPGMNLADIIPEDWSAQWEPVVTRVLEGASHKAIGNLNIKGKLHFFEYSFNPIAEVDGEISGFSFFARDITRKQLIEDEVRRQQQLLASVNKNIREGIFRSTPKNGILYVNEAFAEMFGYDSVEEVLTLDPDVLYVNTARRRDFRNMMQENTFFTNEEAEFKRKDGTVFWGLMSSIKVEDQNGEIYFDGAIRDVTRMREDEQKIIEQNQKLIKVNHELDKFVYSVSHDLRAPLVSLKGLITISQIETTEEKRAYYFDLMSRSVDKLDNFIRDIMGYSRNVRTDLVSQKVDFKQVISDVMEVLQFAPDNGKIEKRVHVAIQGEFYTDLMRLKMIFNNIISNSFRYSDMKKDHPFVEISVTGNEKEVDIRICDNGIGIAQENIDKVFDMFFRGTRNSQGSGIGLYIVKEALDKIGGSITVQSEEGQGTCFLIHLPSIPH